METIHTPTVKVVESHDDALELHGMCCGDPKTGSVRTVYGIENKSELELQAELDDHKASLERKHRARIAAKAFLEKQIDAGQQPEASSEQLPSV